MTTCYTIFFHVFLFGHICSMNNTFSYKTISYPLTHSLSSSFKENTQKDFFLPNFLWLFFELVFLIQWKLWKSFLLINGLFILHELMEFRMKILMPNKTLRRFYPPINRLIIPMTNGIGGFIIFPILDIFMGLLSSIIVNFVRLILTSYFFIIFISSN